MLLFKVKRQDGAQFPSSSRGRAQGFRAPGEIVMVVQEGSGWVMGQDRSKEPISARTAVIWDPGEWVEYGSNGDGDFSIEGYWATVFSEDEWIAMLNETFGTT
jgi:hypothetical protein